MNKLNENQWYAATQIPVGVKMIFSFYSTLVEKRDKSVLNFWNIIKRLDISHHRKVAYLFDKIEVRSCANVHGAIFFANPFSIPEFLSSAHDRRREESAVKKRKTLRPLSRKRRVWDREWRQP